MAIASFESKTPTKMHDLIDEREIGMSEHTPGPWSANGLKNDGGFEISSEGRPFVICTRNPVNHRAGESNANAVLIAAAPDLLAALRQMDDFCQDFSEAVFCRDGKIAGIIRAAIAKATGVHDSSAVVKLQTEP